MSREGSSGHKNKNKGAGREPGRDVARAAVGFRMYSNTEGGCGW